MSEVLHLNQEQFEDEVLHSEIPVIVDFFANWCPPCRRLGPILDRLADEFTGQIRFVKINSDEEPVLAEMFHVTGLPTIVFIEDGKNVGQLVGLPEEAAFRDELRKWVDSRGVVNG